MSENPVVSIIVPSFNHAPYLEKRLTSIFHQTFRDFEVILLDDCSTDGSIEILQTYASRTQVTHVDLNTSNTGSPFRQWQKGIQLARGEFIWIAESDDWAEDSWLATAVQILWSHPDVGLVSQKSHLIDEPGEIIGETNYQFITPCFSCVESCVEKFRWYDGRAFVIDNMLYRSGIYNASGVLFRKHLVEGFSAYVQYKQAGDTLFWTHILLSSNIIILDEKRNYFRKHNQSVTSLNYGSSMIPMVEMYHRIKYVNERGVLSAGQLEQALQKAFLRTMDHIRKRGLDVFGRPQFQTYNKLKELDKAFWIRVIGYVSSPVWKVFRKVKRTLIAMIKRVILRLLQIFGYTLVPTGGLGVPSQGIKAPRHALASQEIAELEKLLIQFGETYPECTGAEPKGPVNWSDPQVAREYLSDWRIGLFHEVVQAFKANSLDVSGKKVLEVGSGTGYLIRLLQKTYGNLDIRGFDTYAALNQLASFLCPGVQFHEKDLFEPYGESYEVIICMETLEHLIDPELAIQHMLNHLEAGGTLFLTVPNGRKDSLPAMGKFPNQKGYWGHINFWSMESWGLFLNKICVNYSVCYGLLSGDDILFAFISNKM